MAWTSGRSAPRSGGTVTSSSSLAAAACAFCSLNCCRRSRSELGGRHGRRRGDHERRAPPVLHPAPGALRGERRGARPHERRGDVVAGPEPEHAGQPEGGRGGGEARGVAVVEVAAAGERDAGGPGLARGARAAATAATPASWALANTAAIRRWRARVIGPTGCSCGGIVSGRSSGSSAAPALSIWGWLNEVRAAAASGARTGVQALCGSCVATGRAGTACQLAPRAAPRRPRCARGLEVFTTPARRAFVAPRARP